MASCGFQGNSDEDSPFWILEPLHLLSQLKEVSIYKRYVSQGVRVCDVLCLTDAFSVGFSPTPMVCGWWRAARAGRFSLAGHGAGGSPRLH